jgi:hypothetical protein
MTRKFAAALVAVFICGTTLAAGARLYDKTDFVPQGSEASLLDAVEKVTVRTIRGATTVYKNVQLLKLNRASLGSGVVSLITPDGATHEFVGKARPETPGMRELGYARWYGESSSGGKLTVTYAVAGHDLVGILETTKTKYSIGNLPGGRYYTISEVLPQRMCDPDPDGKCDCCGTTVAAVARLYGQGDFIPQASEAAVLGKEEAARLSSPEGPRGRSEIVQVIRVNRAAFASGVITLVTPDGVTREFVYRWRPETGGLRERGSASWRGVTASGDTLGVVYSATGFAGQIDLQGGDKFLIGSLSDARFGRVMKLVPRYLAEPRPDTPPEAGSTK